MLDGIVDANLSVMANISGQVNSGSISLFEIGIPGLSFPGYVDVSLRLYAMDSPHQRKDYLLPILASWNSVLNSS